MKFLPLVLAVAMSLGSALSARANTNLLNNGDFETGPFNMIGTVSDWIVDGNGFVADRGPGSASDYQGSTSGTHAAAFDVGGNSQGNTLSQSFGTVVGVVYMLCFDAGIYGKLNVDPLQLHVEVLGGGTLLDQVLTPPDAETYDPNAVDFQHYEFMFTADSTSTTLRFTDIDTMMANGGADLMLDTACVEAVPEPSTIATVILGLGLLLGLSPRVRRLVRAGGY
ncbi:MAG: hypothetical protein M3O66_02785 [Verrucomicrobiota bacterium]|nr:hypothetical protein [Verrucomicrobiota bacterium]